MSPADPSWNECGSVSCGEEYVLARCRPDKAHPLAAVVEGPQDGAHAFVDARGPFGTATSPERILLSSQSHVPLRRAPQGRDQRVEHDPVLSASLSETATGLSVE